MKWFGRKGSSRAGRDAARPFLFRGWSGAPPAGDWPRSYEAQVREAYLGNPVAQRSVRLVAESVAWAPLAADDGGGGGGGGGGAAARALRLAAPALLDAAASHLLLHGNAYLQLLAGADGAPAELFALRPERVSVEPGPGGWPAAYVYKAGETKTRLPARDGLGRPALVHVRATHPLDDHYGLGSLGAAAGAVAIHNAATRWNKALLDNAARPSGALVLGDEGVLADEHYQRLKAELEAEFAGAGNAGRPMLLAGGMKWEAISLSPADMDFVGLKAAAARDIALAFGVPPMLLGLPGDATYANYREANRALWRLTVLPLADRLLGAIGGALAAWWPGLRLRLDIDQVTALAEDRERLWTQVSAADFLSREEKRAMLGMSAEGGEG
ncbi:MAG: phage portal protein [Alphaproteobacteria bacterium]|nr:phage portal protein [Alphaproteobacteria bacterium]